MGELVVSRSSLSFISTRYYLVALFFGLSLNTFTAAQETFRFTGRNDDLWSNQDSWDLEGVPNGDNVYAFVESHEVDGETHDTVIYDLANGILDWLVVGDIGTGKTKMQSGSSLVGNAIMLGRNTGSSGELEMTGAGTQLIANDFLNIGNFGHGILRMSDQAHVDASNLNVGAGSTATGLLEVDNATIDAGEFHVGGHDGSGEMYLTNGGQINVSGNSFIGSAANSVGFASVSGPGSTFSSDSIQVGVEGIGEMSVTNGGQVTDNGLAIGVGAQGSGEVTISDSGSYWNSRVAGVGNASNGVLNILDGATLETQASDSIYTLYMGNSQGVTGVVNVTNANLISDNIGVGFYGSGEFNMFDANVQTKRVTAVYHSQNGENSGVINVDSSESGMTELHSSIYLLMGSVLGAEGNLNLNKGRVFVGTEGAAAYEDFLTGELAGLEGAFLVGSANSSGSNATVDINSGHLNNSGENHGSYVGLLEETTGIIRLRGPGASFSTEQLVLGGHGTGSLTFSNGGTVETDTVILGDQATGDGMISVDGADASLIIANRLYVGRDGSGTLQLNDGFVQVSNTLSIGDMGLVQMTGGTLAGNIFEQGDGDFEFVDGELVVRTFRGNLVQDGGVLAAGNSPGSMTIDGSLTLNAGAVEVEIAGLEPSTQFDFYHVTGDAYLSGMLTVSMLDDFVPSPDDEFLFMQVDGLVTGQFDGLAEGDTVAIFDGFGLSISYLAGDGNDISLTAFSAVPEPGSVFLIGSALTCCLMLGRRRMRSKKAELNQAA